MSHFTMLVAANSQVELEEKMLPYHEYECTGIEEYLEWVDCTEEVTAEYNENPRDYASLEEYAEDWHGYTIRSGKIGHVTNPNAKWDWWVIGGRWSGTIDPNPARKNEVDWKNIKEDGSPPTFGFIDNNGKWVSRENMGWFALTSPNENTENYNTLFWEWFNSLDGDTLLYLVDCHI